ncbi:MAG: hypothetical protein KC496_09480 [Anaerolineae bacterium]|nr:hypothetical protein [Anaerolineae bacterium]
MFGRALTSIVLWLTAMGMIFYLLTLNWILAFFITPMLLYGTFAVFALVWMDEVDFGNGRFYRTRSAAREAESQEEEEEEKRKRDRLDAVLRDLSDEDLLRLRERLSDGTVDDDLLYEQMIGTDGEFVRSRA